MLGNSRVVWSSYLVLLLCCVGEMFYVRDVVRVRENLFYTLLTSSVSPLLLVVVCRFCEWFTDFYGLDAYAYPGEHGRPSMASMHMHIQGSMGGLLWPRCICISSGAREAFYGLDAYAYPGEHGRPSMASMHMHIQGSMGGLLWPRCICISRGVWEACTSLLGFSKKLPTWSKFWLLRWLQIALLCHGEGTLWNECRCLSICLFVTRLSLLLLPIHLCVWTAGNSCDARRMWKHVPLNK